MGVRVLTNTKEGISVLYDSVSETAFGPLIRDYESEDGKEAFSDEVAAEFLDWLGEDPRRMLPVDVVIEYRNFIAVIEHDGWEAVAEGVAS